LQQPLRHLRPSPTVVIMTDAPAKVAEAIQLARRTHGIVWQNIVFALGVKGVVIALGTVGIATLWEAVFADVAVALLAIINASRILHTSSEANPLKSG